MISPAGGYTSLGLTGVGRVWLEPWTWDDNGTRDYGQVRPPAHGVWDVPSSSSGMDKPGLLEIINRARSIQASCRILGIPSSDRERVGKITVDGSCNILSVLSISNSPDGWLEVCLLDRDAIIAVCPSKAERPNL